MIFICDNTRNFGLIKRLIGKALLYMMFYTCCFYSLMLFWSIKNSKNWPFWHKKEMSKFLLMTQNKLIYNYEKMLKIEYFKTRKEMLDFSPSKIIKCIKKYKKCLLVLKNFHYLDNLSCLQLSKKDKSPSPLNKKEIFWLFLRQFLFVIVYYLN